MNLKSLFPLFMLEYAGVLREFACVCVNMLEFAFVCLCLPLFACFCLCLREYAGVIYVCLYLLGSLVFIRSLLEYAGVCLNFHGSGQVGLSGCDPVWVRPDEGQSGSTGCWPVGVDYPDATRIHLSFDRIRPGRFGRMRAGRGRLDEVRSGSTTLMRPAST